MQKYLHLLQIVETEKTVAKQLRQQIEDGEIEIERLKAEVTRAGDSEQGVRPVFGWGSGPPLCRGWVEHQHGPYPRSGSAHPQCSQMGSTGWMSVLLCLAGLHPPELIVVESDGFSSSTTQGPLAEPRRGKWKHTLLAPISCRICRVLGTRTVQSHSGLGTSVSLFLAHCPYPRRTAYIQLQPLASSDSPSRTPQPQIEWAGGTAAAGTVTAITLSCATHSLGQGTCCAHTEVPQRVRCVTAQLPGRRDPGSLCTGHRQGGEGAMRKLHGPLDPCRSSSEEVNEELKDQVQGFLCRGPHLKPVIL